MDEPLRRSLHAVADFYDRRLVGDVGPLGFRRTTALGKLLPSLHELAAAGALDPGRSRFLDLGCGDGRVNVLMSYLVQVSVGIEIEEWTLDEYAGLREQLDISLEAQALPPVPQNIHLFHGDATSGTMHHLVRRETGVGFEDVDLFFTFLTAHEEFAALIAARGRPGCTFLVYGMNRIFPGYDGLELIESLSPLRDVLAVYRKSGC